MNRFAAQPPLGQPPPQQRIGIAHSTDQDTDHGPDTGGRDIPQLNPGSIAAVAALRMHHLMQMVADNTFDASHPVDEWGPQGGQLGAAVIINQVAIQADYDMPERISKVEALIPVGCTLAQLQLGQRILTVYSGAALTVPLIFQLPFTGMILNSDDSRILQLTGTLTTAPYLGLSGYALTRGQFS